MSNVDVFRRMLPGLALGTTLLLGACGSPDAPKTEEPSPQQESAAEATEEATASASPENSPEETPKALAVLTDPPPVEKIDGCDSEKCSAAQALSYEHPYKDTVTVVLYADYSTEDAGQCKIAVFDSDEELAQIHELEWVAAWYERGDGLAKLFHFMDPPTDATENIFIRMPGGDGEFATGLSVASTGYFELFDLSYIGEITQRFEDPMVAEEWGEIDENGFYTLKIEDVVLKWNGQKYVEN